MSVVNSFLEKTKTIKEENRFFKLGEIVELKKRQFRIKQVKPDELRLKLLKKRVKV